MGSSESSGAGTAGKEDAVLSVEISSRYATQLGEHCSLCRDCASGWWQSGMKF